MGRYIDGQDRTQSVLFPERLDDWVEEDNPVRVVDVFVEGLNLAPLGFERAQPAETGRPAYHPGTLLKIYIYGYLNRIQSSRRLEREAQRNVELIWLTGRLMPDFKTIADFRRDNGEAIRRVCREFVLICRQMQLFADAAVAIDGSKFKAVNNRDKNFTDRKLKARMQQIEESIAHYLEELDRADRESAHVPAVRVTHLKDKLATVRAQAQKLADISAQLQAAPDGQVSLTDPDARSMATSGRGTGMVGYNVQTAVDVKHHLIVEHEVTNLGHDRTQLEMMARRTRDVLEGNSLTIDARTELDPKTDLRAGFDRFSPENLAANKPVVDLLKRFAEEKNATPAQIALAWLLVQKPWIVPIPGTRNMDHLNENLGAINVQLTPGDLREIGTAVAKIKVHGGRMNEEQMRIVDQTA